jgi:hypothetical protein
MNTFRAVGLATVLTVLAFPVFAQVGTRAPDGERCKGIGGPGHAGCASGYCLPGPAVVCSSDVAQGFCTNRKYNCALPGAKGGLYGDTIPMGRHLLICQNPGRGRWAQYCSRR